MYIVEINKTQGDRIFLLLAEGSYLLIWFQSELELKASFLY